LTGCGGGGSVSSSAPSIANNVKSFFTDLVAKKNYSLHDSNYAEGISDITTEDSWWYAYGASGYMFLGDRAYGYALDENNKLVKGSFENELESVSQINSFVAATYISNAFTRLGFSEKDGILVSTEETAKQKFALLDNYQEGASDSISEV